MNKIAFNRGFAAGLLKAAGGDNQPGPMPQQPAPPDTHRVRNVALGAALLAGGILGAKGLKNQNQLATKMVEKNRSAMGKDILGKMRSGQAGAHAAGADWLKQQGTKPGLGEKAKALAGHYGAKIKAMAAPSRDLQNQRFMAEHGIKDVSPEGRAKRIKSIRNRVIGAVAAPAVLAGGAIAGASGASRAREQQSNDQPGLG